MDFTEPTVEQCSSNEKMGEDEYTVAYALWFPQMGGYQGKAVARFNKNEEEPCIDLFVWHDGEFPFGDEDEKPRFLHLCSAAQFVKFGETLMRLTGGGK